MKIILTLWRIKLSLKYYYYLKAKLMPAFVLLMSIAVIRQEWVVSISERYHRKVLVPRININFIHKKIWQGRSQGVIGGKSRAFKSGDIRILPDNDTQYLFWLIRVLSIYKLEVFYLENPHNLCKDVATPKKHSHNENFTPTERITVSSINWSKLARKNWR